MLDAGKEINQINFVTEIKIGLSAIKGSLNSP